MSAMLRKRKQNQSIGICRDGPGFRVKPRARPWLRARRARIGHLVVVIGEAACRLRVVAGSSRAASQYGNNALKTRLPRRGYASPSLGLRVALVAGLRVALVGATRRRRPLKSVSDRWRSVMTSSYGSIGGPPRRCAAPSLQHAVSCRRCRRGYASPSSRLRVASAP
jgi:hypothetical protein